MKAKEQKREMEKTMEDDSKLMSCLGWLVAGSAIIAIGTLMRGWALSTIWNWFIPPIFRLTTLTLWQAMGVAMVFQLFTGTNRISKSDDGEKKTSTEKFISNALESIFVPLFSVGIAYVILQFAF